MLAFIDRAKESLKAVERCYSAILVTPSDALGNISVSPTLREVEDFITQGEISNRNSSCDVFVSNHFAAVSQVYNSFCLRSVTSLSVSTDIEGDKNEFFYSNGRVSYYYY